MTKRKTFRHPTFPFVCIEKRRKGDETLFFSNSHLFVHKRVYRRVREKRVVPSPFRQISSKLPVSVWSDGGDEAKSFRHPSVTHKRNLRNFDQECTLPPLTTIGESIRDSFQKEVLFVTAGACNRAGSLKISSPELNIEATHKMWGMH